MVLDPSLILYACISKEKTVLAEFNSKDHHDLGLLALKCLDKAPLFHSVFSHTIRGKRYMFLIQDQEPFTYFAISDESLENMALLEFLQSVKDAFEDVAKDDWSRRKFDSLSSHCFQGEFNPVFHQLLAVSGEMEGPNVKRKGMKYFHERNGSMDSTMVGNGKIPLLASHGGMALKKKKKMRFFNDLLCIGKENDDGERKVDGCDDDDYDSSLEFSRPTHKNTHNRGVSSNQNQNGLLASVDSVVFQRSAKKSWQKHVWIVLSLDLIICLILFCIWLYVCRGFKCIDG